MSNEQEVKLKEWFDPDNPKGQRTTAGKAEMGDRTDQADYVYTDSVKLAVRVALATRRPLLVSGPSGCGKSSMAPDVARVLDWGLERVTITSRMQGEDLLYQVDHLARLQDAQAQEETLDPTFRRYLKPGILWVAFDKRAAQEKRGSYSDGAGIARAVDSPPKAGEGVVVLLDEIDKAEPDVPNNLLLPLGSYQFPVKELGSDAVVRAQRVPLLILTTNNERRLPDAFVRRCVEVKLEAPKTSGDLAQFGTPHFKERAESYQQKHPEVADLLLEVAKLVMAGSPKISIAEYLDTVRGVLALDLTPASSEWQRLPEYTSRKESRGIGL